MKKIEREQLLEILNWRYATKQFDPAKKIDAETWRTLEDALVLSPSSFGLQPWKFIVVTDPAIREKLKAASWNQSQVTDCSHHVVFAILTNIDEALVDRYIKRSVELTGRGADTYEALRGMMTGFIAQANSQGWIQEWATRQAYIALGNFMTSAATIGIDTCPMEGINPAQYDEMLGLAAQGLKTVVACAAGHRAGTDRYATAPKIRYPREEVLLRF